MSYLCQSSGLIDCQQFLVKLFAVPSLWYLSCDNACVVLLFGESGAPFPVAIQWSLITFSSDVSRMSWGYMHLTIFDVLTVCLLELPVSFPSSSFAWQFGTSGFTERDALAIRSAHDNRRLSVAGGFKRTWWSCYLPQWTCEMVTAV